MRSHIRIRNLKIVLISLVALLTASALWAAEHDLYTALLKDHVLQGLVSYPQLCKDERLGRYISQLSRTDPSQITDERSRLAFWLNAYNAYTLKIICDHYPVKSINELHRGGLVFGSITGNTIWHKKIVTIHQKPISLHIIEHEIIRLEFKEPRIHFALVCAAYSCPPLRSEAYEGERLDQQLSDQGRIFLQQPQKNRVDLEQRIVYLSPIFSWFRSDFGQNTSQVLDFILPFLAEDSAQAIRSNMRAWRIRYTPYDWSLNER